MEILFVSQCSTLDAGAPQTHTLKTAQCLSQRGHSVTALTGFPLNVSRGRVVWQEQIGGVRVIRSAIYPAADGGFTRRLLNRVSFAIASVLAAHIADGPGIVIAETPPLFTAIAGALVARACQVPLLLDVGDLWPDSATQLGGLRNRRPMQLTASLARLACRQSAVMTVPTAEMRATLLRRGESPDKVLHLPHAVDIFPFEPDPPRGSRPQRVVYQATLGARTLIDAAAELASAHDDFEFLVFGNGAERAAIARAAQERGLTNVRTQGGGYGEPVPELIARADVAVVFPPGALDLDNGLPAELLEYMAAGRPIVASAAGDVARLLERLDAGVACPPGDPLALATGIRDVTRDPARAQAMGANGRRYVQAHYSREAFVDALEATVLALAGDERERARVQRVYSSYKTSPARQRAWSGANPGNQRIISALYEQVRASLIASENFPTHGRALLDVGCGHGDLLGWLGAHGAALDCLHGLDMLEDRVAKARQRVEGVRFGVADARTLPLPSGSVNAVILSTVLSSILSRDDRKRVAAEAIRVLRPGGVILCYDLRYANPRNRMVRRISRRELERLFPGAQIETCSLTLLPPLARRLGPATDALYGRLAALPPLRTHLFAVVRCP